MNKLLQIIIGFMLLSLGFMLGTLNEARKEEVAVEPSVSLSSQSALIQVNYGDFTLKQGKRYSIVIREIEEK